MVAAVVVVVDEEVVELIEVVVVVVLVVAMGVVVVATSTFDVVACFAVGDIVGCELPLLYCFCRMVTSWGTSSSTSAVTGQMAIPPMTMTATKTRKPRKECDVEGDDDDGKDDAEGEAWPLLFLVLVRDIVVVARHV